MARTRRVGPLDVSSTIIALFNAYGQDVNEVIDDAMKEVGTEARDQLRSVKQFSPQGNPTGKYSKDWQIEVQPVKRYSRKYVVYNEEHYRLTHLLESGHAKVLWGHDTGEDVPGYKHIEPVNNKVQERLAEEVIERIIELNT